MHYENCNELFFRLGNGNELLLKSNFPNAI